MTSGKKGLLKARATKFNIPILQGMFAIFAFVENALVFKNKQKSL
jgi:hypothetical protein